jgi:hypothetical protein
MLRTGRISVPRHRLVKPLAARKHPALRRVSLAAGSNPRRIHESNSFQTHENSLVNGHFS